MAQITSYFKEGDIDSVNVCIDANINKCHFDTPDSFGNTPLSYAIVNDNLFMVAMLVTTYSVNIHRRNIMGENAINIAMKYGFNHIVVFLQQNGAIS